MRVKITVHERRINLLDTNYAPVLKKSDALPAKQGYEPFYVLAVIVIVPSCVSPAGTP